MHIDAAQKCLRDTHQALQPYSGTMSALPPNGGLGKGPQCDSALVGVNKSIENAIGELDYTMIDNGYIQVTNAIFQLAPFAK